MSVTSSITITKSGLSPRYEIRRLGPEHIAWAKAIVVHSNMFDSPVWPLLYPHDRVQRSYDALDPDTDYLFSHQIESGMSWGIFDKEYIFKDPSSVITGGALHWDPKDTAATSDKLLQQMDFPLVSVALAYDLIKPLDHEKLGPLMNIIPHFGPIYAALDSLDKRDAASWAASGPKQVLMRNSTCTRGDYAGNGAKLMKHLAHFLMRKAKTEGYRGIQIECFHDAVTKVWLTALPEEGMRGDLISDIPSLCEWTEEKDGKPTKPFAPVTQRVTKIFVNIEQ